MNIGFIGLGQLGSRLCTILLDNGYNVVVSDLNTKAVDEQVRHGAGVANSLPDMANAK